MNATPGHPALRARIAEALQEALDDLGHSRVAADLGVNRSTIHRREADLHAWPAQDLLELAVRCSAVGEAVAAYLAGRSEPEQEPTQAARQLMADIGLHGEITALEAAIMADGKIDEQDRAAYWALVDKVATQHALHQELLANLKARIFPGGGR